MNTREKRQSAFGLNDAAGVRTEVLQAVTWLWTFSLTEPGTQEHDKKSKNVNPFFTELI